MSKFKLTFDFPTPAARGEFITWLCESGEQSFWQWCEVDQEERPAVTFDYWNGTNKGQEFVGGSDSKEVVVRTKEYDMNE